MAALNNRRLWLGTLVGGIVWIIWSMIVNVVLLGSRYATAQAAGSLLQAPRYGLFLPIWFVTLFVLTCICATFYALARGGWGPGPRTALLVGLMVGFAAGFPMNFSLATWSPLDRVFPLWWSLEMLVGGALASLVAGWLYRD